jgi:hypothetical protein
MVVFHVVRSWNLFSAFEMSTFDYGPVPCIENAKKIIP